MSESLADTLTFEGSVPRATWTDTCFENQLLYLLEINALAGLLTDISICQIVPDNGNFAEILVIKLF